MFRTVVSTAASPRDRHAWLVLPGVGCLLLLMVVHVLAGASAAEDIRSRGHALERAGAPQLPENEWVRKEGEGEAQGHQGLGRILEVNGTSDGSPGNGTVEVPPELLAEAVEQERKKEALSIIDKAAVMVAVQGMLLLGIAVTAVARMAQTSWVPESLLLVLLGVGFGLVLNGMHGKDVRELRDDTDMYEGLITLVFLPIIIFESAYDMDRAYFFKQLGKIGVYAVWGTVISTVVCGGVLYGLGVSSLGDGGNAGQSTGVPRFYAGEAFAFGALVSAIDPVATISVFASRRVDPVLNALVFGESVVNDAVAIVLYDIAVATLKSKAVDSGTQFLMAVLQLLYITVTSTAIAVAITGICAAILAYARLEKHKELQIIVVLLCSYTAFQIGVLVKASGVYCSLVCGILMRLYCHDRYLTHDAQDASLSFFRVAAALAETAIFFLVGVNVAVFAAYFRLDFFVWTLLLIVAGRAANIFPLSALINLANRYVFRTSADAEGTYAPAGGGASGAGPAQEAGADPDAARALADRSKYVSGNMQLAMFHAGLRGAVTFALSIQFPNNSVGTGHRETVIACACSIILFTIGAFGGTTELVLRRLGIPMGVQRADEVFHSADFELELQDVTRTREGR